MVKLLCLEWSRMDEGGLHNTCYKDSANGTFGKMRDGQETAVTEATGWSWHYY